MKKVESKQRGVKFLWCKSPITIDKRESWGQEGENLQIAKKWSFSENEKRNRSQSFGSTE